VEAANVHQTARDRFHRSVLEYFKWLSLSEPRPSADAAWRPSCVVVAALSEPMPAECAAKLSLPNGSTYAEGSQRLISEMHGIVPTGIGWSKF
jgi:hypothetical protein